MTSTRRALLAFVVASFVCVPAPGGSAEGGGLVTATLLASDAGSQHPEDRSGVIWLAQDPPKTAVLDFDLSRLPAGLAVERAVLRLVAEKVAYKPGGIPAAGHVIVKAGLAADAGECQSPRSRSPGTALVALKTLADEGNTTAWNEQPESDGRLRQALAERRGAGTDPAKIKLCLYTETAKANSLFTAPQLPASASAGKASQLPRLVVQYRAAPKDLLDAMSWPQYQHDPEHTGRSEWAPFRTPKGFTLRTVQVDGGGTIADYPLLWRGNLYLVYKILDKNYLVAIDFRGRELWRRAIGTGTIQRPPVIGPGGLLYLVTEKAVDAYQLDEMFRSAEGGPLGRVATYSFGAATSLGNHADVTVGNDGSLFVPVKEDDQTYIYAFTPDLRPFIRQGPYAAGEAQISTLTASADGQTLFAETPQGAVLIDVANPQEAPPLRLGDPRQAPGDAYHAPVAGPEAERVIFSDYKADGTDGHLWAVGRGVVTGSRHGGLTPQPVVASDGALRFLQKRKLQAADFRTLRTASEGEASGATSNLVMDGADNSYFWDNGVLYLFPPDLKTPVVADFVSRGARATLDRSERPDPPERFIRLVLGPDGTLWANNRLGSTLAAFVPTYSDPDLVLTKGDIRTHTVYRAEGVLRSGTVTIPQGAKVLLQAGQEIRFAPGFTVEKGASLLARTGW